MAQELFGNNLVGKNGKVENIAEEGRVIGIYFSAHWCPPCRGFTPALVTWYNKMKEAGKNLEVVFVSSDKNQAEFDSYFGEMPWLAIDYEQDDAKQNLKTKYGVRGIPTLVFINGKTGETITQDGRGKVSGDSGFTGAGLW